MNQRWGSQSRSRIALVLCTACVVAWCVMLLRERAERVVLTTGGGPPVIVVATRQFRFTIEAFNPATGQSDIVFERPTGYLYDEEGIPSIVAVRDGHVIAWVENDALHMVETTPPHRRESWKIDAPVKPFQIVGLSESGEYAVFEYGRIVTRHETLPGIFTIDLRTGKVLSEETRVFARSRGADGAFLIYHPTLARNNNNAPELARLDENGEWERKPLPKHLADLLDGDWRGKRLPGGDVELFTAEDQAIAMQAKGRRPGVHLSAPKFSPADHRFFVRSGDELFVGDGDSPNLRLLRRLCELGGHAAFQADGQAVVFVDAWGDLRRIEIDTGRETLLANPGTRQFRWFAAAFVVALVVAGLWARLAWAEGSLGWALVDVLVVICLLSLAAAIARAAPLGIHHAPGFGTKGFGSTTWTASQTQMMWCVGVAWVSLGFATMYLVAWYWAHGPGPVLWRLCGGTACVAVFAVPIVLLYRATYGPQLPVFGWWEHVATSMLGITLVSALVLSIPRWFGWRLRREEVATGGSLVPSARFGLASMFAVVMLVAFGIALREGIERIRFDWLGWEVVVAAVAFAPSLGAMLPVVCWLRDRQAIVRGVVLVVLWNVVDVTLLYAVDWDGSRRMVGVHLLARVIGIAFGLLPVLLLRKHGYRWTRLSKS